MAAHAVCGTRRYVDGSLTGRTQAAPGQQNRFYVRGHLVVMSFLR